MKSEERLGTIETRDIGGEQDVGSSSCCWRGVSWAVGEKAGDVRCMSTNLERSCGVKVPFSSLQRSYSYFLWDSRRRRSQSRPRGCPRRCAATSQLPPRPKLTAPSPEAP